MTTHITLTTFVVFFALVAFGAIIFALARSASRGTFSPDVPDDAAPEEAEQDDATDDDDTVPARQPAQRQDMPSTFDA